jgi:flagellar biosynthetic protein FliO
VLSFWDYVQAIIIIGAIILAAYYVTKIVAKTSGGGFRKTTGIKLIASQPLGRDKSVAVVEVGEFSYILGVSAQRVELLDKLPKSELSLKKEEPAKTPPSIGVSFREELNKRFNRPNKND